MLTGLAVITAVEVFSKESVVVLPVVIVLYELVGGKQSLVKAGWRGTLPACLAMLPPIGVMLWQRAAVLASSLPAEWPCYDNPIVGAGFWIGRLTAIKVLARYLWLAFWPMKLSADYSYSQIALARGSLEDWVCWLAVAAALALTVILWNRNRLAFFFAAFAFLKLVAGIESAVSHRHHDGRAFTVSASRRIGGRCSPSRSMPPQDAFVFRASHSRFVLL